MGDPERAPRAHRVQRISFWVPRLPLQKPSRGRSECGTDSPVPPTVPLTWPFLTKKRGVPDSPRLTAGRCSAEQRQFKIFSSGTTPLMINQSLQACLGPPASLRLQLPGGSAGVQAWLCWPGGLNPDPLQSKVGGDGSIPACLPPCGENPPRTELKAPETVPSQY